MLFQPPPRLKLVSNVSRQVGIESLESRRLLCGAVAADVLEPAAGLDSSGPKAAEAISLQATSVSAAAATLPVKIKGFYVGHYVGAKYGKGTMSFNITKYTHTGHFSGTYQIDNSGDTFNGIAKGVVQVSKHIHVTISDGAITGDFTGTASRTGGSFYGSYQVVVAGKTSDHGTYHVGKA